MFTSVSAWDHRWTRLSLISGITLCVLVVVYSFWRYPMLLSPLLVGLVFLGAFVAAVIIYLLSALIWTRTRTLSSRLAVAGGMRWGLLIGAAWVIEMITGNMLDGTLWWNHPLYYGSTAIALGLPIVAGALAARFTRQWTTGAQVGWWSGLSSGLIAFLALILITVFPVYFSSTPYQSLDPHMLAALRRSGAPDFATFSVGDSLAGAISHLFLIGPLVGSVLGALGGLFGHRITSYQ